MQKPRLQLGFGLQLVFAHAALAVGTLLPVAHVDFVATNVNIVIGEQVEHLTIDVLAELQHAVLAGTKRRGEELSPAGALLAGESVVVVDSAEAVAGNIDFGHDIYATLTGEGNYLADIILRVKTTIFPLRIDILRRQLQIGIVLRHSIAHAHGILIVGRTPGAALGEQRVFLDFDAPALVVGQVPMELVDLVECQHVEQLHHFFLGEEMARAVEFHASPCETRGVKDLAGGKSDSSAYG